MKSHFFTDKSFSLKNCQSLRHVGLFVTPWSVARQMPLSMGLSRQDYWSGFPFPSPWHLPDPGVEPTSLSPVFRGRFFFNHSVECKSILGSFRVRASADYRAIALERKRSEGKGNILRRSQKDTLKFLCFLKDEKHLKKAQAELNQGLWSAVRQETFTKERTVRQLEVYGKTKNAAHHLVLQESSHQPLQWLTSRALRQELRTENRVLDARFMKGNLILKCDFQGVLQMGSARTQS